ncbi:MAG: hypothetical protein M1828_001276 [Chrysothrix sp. TS-e1954]|nr:MAG: hypothetical protein M1828_001276 [Chrysothrix sp. TS-e1954]
MAPSASDKERSVSRSRRISSFFIPGSSNGQTSSALQKPSIPDNKPPSRPGSRGRPLGKLTKEDRRNSALLAPAPTIPPASLITSHSTPDLFNNGMHSPLPLPSPNFPRDGASSNAPSGASTPNYSKNHFSPRNSTEEVPELSMPIRQKTDTLERDKMKKRRTWLPGQKQQSQSSNDLRAKPQAWVAGHSNRVISYDLNPLTNAERTSELWDDGANTFVYLFPKQTQKGPSFKIHSSIISSSSMLTQLAYGNVYSKRNVSGQSSYQRQNTAPQLSLSHAPGSGTPPLNDNASSGSSRGTRATDDSFDDAPSRIDLYVPILSGSGALSSAAMPDTKVTQEDTDALVAVRNMFAFLVGQSLVATERLSSMFAILLKIAESLKTYGFTNLDGSTFGEVANSSFDNYIDELGLADCRSSREKTIEAIVLGERMRSVMLYNEAFVHAIGKYSDVQEVSKLPGPDTKFNLISLTTRNRMERASIDLQTREKSINTRLMNFDFHAVFSGIMNSKTSDERKSIRFGAWKDAFNATRKHVMSFYKQVYGSWPPKASSKKNDLETSGLNRLVLKALYRDFGAFYDLYVDRHSMTSRAKDIAFTIDESHEDEEGEPVARVLRRVFDEYDRSLPPVQPPVPYDVPLLPSLVARVPSTDSKGGKPKLKKLSEKETDRVLDSSCNEDTLSRVRSSPFLNSMRTFERRQARGCNLIELTNHRAGTWIFIYVVLQALPLLVVDSPGVRFHHGVEYFLCEPPRGGVPWAIVDPDSGRGRRTRNWYGISGGQGVISLPSDLIEHGMDGIYRRSHCWKKAAEWSGDAPPTHAATMPNSHSRPPTSRRTSEQFQSSIMGQGVSDEPQSVAGSNEQEALDQQQDRLFPPSVPGSRPGSRPGSSAGLARRKRSDSAMRLGLEALPLPPGIEPGLGPSEASRLRSESGPMYPVFPQYQRDSSRSRSRPPSSSYHAQQAHGRQVSSGQTFDDIFATMDNGKKGKKK